MIVTFSGIDGAGKSTQITHLINFLKSQGCRPVLLWSRGGYTTLLIRIKTIFRRLAGGKLPPPGDNEQRQAYLKRRFVRKLWLIISILDLIRLYAVQMRLWLLLGRFVICDRYVWDTMIDFKLNFPGEDVHRWWLWHLLERLAARPQASFLFLLPLEESIRRCSLKEDPYPSPYEVQVQRFAMYKELQTSRNFVIVDARQSIDAMSEIIISNLRNRKCVH